MAVSLVELKDLEWPVIGKVCAQGATVVAAVSGVMDKARFAIGDVVVAAEDLPEVGIGSGAVGTALWCQAVCSGRASAIEVGWASGPSILFVDKVTHGSA